MPKVGDRVIVQGVKIGNPSREGTCIGIAGKLINVRWSDGTTSLFTPGAGSVSFEPGNGKAASKPASKPAAKKAGKTAPKAKAPTKKQVAKKPAPKKPAKKPAKKR